MYHDIICVLNKMLANRIHLRYKKARWLSENANMYVYERYVFMNACLSFARVQLSCDHAFLPVFPTDLTSELYESTSLPNMCIMSSNHG